LFGVNGVVNVLNDVKAASKLRLEPGLRNSGPSIKISGQDTRPASIGKGEIPLIESPDRFRRIVHVRTNPFLYRIRAVEIVARFDEVEKSQRLNCEDQYAAYSNFSGEFVKPVFGIAFGQVRKNGECIDEVQTSFVKWQFAVRTQPDPVTCYSG